MNDDFKRVIRENEPRLVRIARHYAGPNDWQDLMQEITISLWKGLPGFEGRASLSTWIYRVAVNTALQYVRKRSISTEPLDAEPVDSTDVDDQMALLERFLASLDPVNRAVLLLDLEGLSREEVSDVLGISAGAVAVRMTRLKQHFSDNFMEEA